VSLDSAVYPALVSKGLLRGLAFDGYFIDMGIPEDLARARAELPSHLRRPAVFFDRDGVLNVEKNYVHKRADFEWIDGAVDAIRLVNERGWFAFVVTNQAGVAHGYYEESAIAELHAFMEEYLAARGAHIDAFEYCPHHPEGMRETHRRDCDRRKPGPGMIRDLLQAWPVDNARSFLIGDRPHDIAAANAAGITGHLFTGGNLMKAVKDLLV
jgi:D-glycero-D-manno-heptose 1,7-bisphosphate phosphatase